MPKSPKIAPDAPTEAPAVPEDVAGERGGDPGQDVEEEHQPGAIHLLHDLPGKPQGVHVEQQVEDVVRVVDQNDGEQPIDLAAGDQVLVELELQLERAAGTDLARRRRPALHRDQGRDHRHADDQVGHEGRQHVAAAAREVAASGTGVAGLLGEPAQARGDQRLVGGGGAPLALAVGVERALEVLGANPRRRDLTPGSIRCRRLGQGGHLLPRGQGVGLAVQAVERVAHAVQGGRGNVPVRRAERPAVQGQGVFRLTRLQQLVGPLDQGDGRRPVQRARGRRVEARRNGG